MIDRGKLLSDLEFLKRDIELDALKNLYDKNLLKQGINKSIEVVKRQEEKGYTSWLMNRFLRKE